MKGSQFFPVKMTFFHKHCLLIPNSHIDIEKENEFDSYSLLKYNNVGKYLHKLTFLSLRPK